MPVLPKIKTQTAPTIRRKKRKDKLKSAREKLDQFRKKKMQGSD